MVISHACQTFYLMILWIVKCFKIRHWIEIDVKNIVLRNETYRCREFSFFAHMPLQLFHLNIMNFCYFLTDSVAAIYVNVLRLQNFLNLFHLSLGFIHFLFAFLLLCYYQMIYRPCKIYSNWKYFTLRKLWVALIKSWKTLRSALLVLRKPRVGLKFALRVLYPHCRPQGPSLFS